MIVTHRSALARLAATLLILLLAIGAWAQKTQRFNEEPAPDMVAGIEEPSALPAPGMETATTPNNAFPSREGAALTLGQP